MPIIRLCREDERDEVYAIVNAAAERYRGVIPEDCWHEPYMPEDALDEEIAAGVEFWGYENDDRLAAVMGVQPVKDVVLIRHAYVRPEHQGQGIGGALLRRLTANTEARILIGTWAAAEWAIGFYRKHGFVQVTPEEKDELLKTYWDIPERQIETSVVLAKPPH
jgi:GNAT superfamily N-acetyltransferase